MPERAPAQPGLADPPPCPAYFPQAALARHTPWPPAARQAPLNPTPAMLEAMTGEPLPCVRLAYAFFYLPTAQAAALLRLSLDAANQVLAVDFKLAERNLELPAVLGARCLAGLGTLCRGYCGTRPGARAAATPANFLRHGGIEGLARQVEAVVLERRTLLGGAAALLRLARP